MHSRGREKELQTEEKFIIELQLETFLVANNRFFLRHTEQQKSGDKWKLQVNMEGMKQQTIAADGAS